MAGEEMMRRATWIVGLIAFGLAIAAAQNQNNAATAPQASTAKPATSTAIQSQDMGELKFQQNCSRCHNAPQDLSPRISGTVVMHMRVRASLSDSDVKAILKYLAP
jgi:cytochrome c5